MSRYKIITTRGEYCFTGNILKDMETVDRHFYETIEGDIIHFRKDDMVVVIEYHTEEDDFAETKIQNF